MVYVHIPFCKSFCSYCGFYSEVKSEKRIPEYLNAVIREIEHRKQEIIESSDKSKGCINTIYIGGGTPSILPAEMLCRIISSIRSILGKNCIFDEITVEVNPDDIADKGGDYVKSLLEAGVTRISMGVQSFDDKILSMMKRRHSADKAKKAFEILRTSGAGNIGIDLIFGIPGQSKAVWQKTIQTALSLDPEHISAYQLSIDQGSELCRLHEKGLFKEQDENICREQYDLICRMLCENSYEHYEISNFAKKNHISLHNSAYWRRIPYVGIGAGAHSLTSDNIRKFNTNELNYISEEEILTEDNIITENIMLSLRTSKGIDKKFLLGHSDETTIRHLENQGMLMEIGNYFRIPEDCFFIADNIISRLI